MNIKWIVIFFILISIVAVYGLSKEPHEFSSDKCTLCHFDEKKEPMNIKPFITSACETCHPNLQEIISHPTDIYPNLLIPEDMPLIEGRLTCVTCHYVHPSEKKQFVNKKYFLRRTNRGPIFCSTCHKMDEEKHVILENVHMGLYIVTDRATRIDKMSIECITCHDKYINEPVGFLGAGTWNHFKSSNHPIGISYQNISPKKMHQFRPASMLPKKMRLFNGKIGCGTCHDIYSKLKFMLVMENTGSKLCLECHIK